MSLPNRFFITGVAVLLLLCGVEPLPAQQDQEIQTLAALLPGTTLPVQLERGLQAGKISAGTPVVARTTQRVPVGAHRYLKSGAVVVGVVERSGAADQAIQNTTRDTLSLRFHALRYHGHETALSVDAVAIANFTEVAATRLPANGSTDRGNPSPASWTTRQVGGDEVYRSGWSGDVCDTVMRTVGFADYNGVYRLAAEGASAPALAFPTALGVFSTSATGLFGYPTAMSLRSASGVITLSGPHGQVALRRGDNILLRVIQLPSAPASP